MYEQHITVGLKIHVLCLYGRNVREGLYCLRCVIYESKTLRVTRLKGRRRLRVFVECMLLLCSWSLVWLGSWSVYVIVPSSTGGCFVFFFCSCSTVGAYMNKPWAVGYNCTATTTVYFHLCDLLTFVFDTLLIKNMYCKSYYSWCHVCKFDFYSTHPLCFIFATIYLFI